MPCGLLEEQKQINKLLKHIQDYNDLYQKQAQEYLTSTSATSGAILAQTLGPYTNFGELVSGTLVLNGNTQVNQTVSDGTGGLVLSSANFAGTFTLYHGGSSDTGRLRVGETTDAIIINSQGQVGIGIVPTNRVHIASIGNQPSITLRPAASAASATQGDLRLPGLPEEGFPCLGFLRININGRNCKIPFYAD